MATLRTNGRFMARKRVGDKRFSAQGATQEEAESKLKEIVDAHLAGQETIDAQITKLKYVLKAMRARCNCETNESYKYYGALGVTICEEWSNRFEHFIGWAFLNGYKPGLQIDRINPYGNYEPKNCRWVTPAVQANNHRRHYKMDDAA